MCSSPTVGCLLAYFSRAEGWWALVNWEHAESEYARVLAKYGKKNSSSGVTSGVLGVTSGVL